MADPSDRLDGSRYRHPIEIRYADTDALGHVNNAVYLSYFEMARAGYYAAVMGVPFGSGESAGAHTFVIAEAHVRYRQPAFFGEPLVAGCRVPWVSRSSFGLEYHIEAHASAVGAARLVADGETVQVMVDPATKRARRVPADLLAAFERFEGRTLPDKPTARRTSR